jgi:Protein of unknown function (DUF3108)
MDVFRRSMLIATMALALGAAAPQATHADTRLEARYTLSVARIPIGTVHWTVEADTASYGAAANGAARGVLRILTSGHGTLTAQGLIRDGRPVPTRFTSETVSDGETASVKMEIESGTAKELSVTVPPHGDRVPLTDAHRRGIIDPLSAMLASANRSGEVISAEPCERTLPIFDGTRRFDLRLTFKRFDTVKIEQGYNGAGVVCAVAFQAIAGHRASSPLVSYLSGGRDMELWLAPLVGTRLLAPVRLSITSMLGDLVLKADRFDVAVTLPRGSNVGTR